MRGARTPPAADLPAGSKLIRRVVAVFLALLLAPAAAFAACTPIASGTPQVWRAAAGDATVGISFLGHASFLIESPAGVRAVTDYSGVFAPSGVPDIVTMNRAHSMHHTLNPDPRIRHPLQGWQEGANAPRHDVVLKDMRVTNLPTNLRAWSGGTEVNGNSIFIFETAGLCIAHLGHLHHLLLPADLDALGRIDILMIAVDGGYTLGHRDAIELIEQIHPRVVLPMHYFTQDTLARFLSMMRERFAVDVRTSSSIDLSRVTLPVQPTVIVLPGPH
ncbi:MAG: MBL fold metallo-hydrolase [Acetobacteraceae bacterium]